MYSIFIGMGTGGAIPIVTVVQLISCNFVPTSVHFVAISFMEVIFKRVTTIGVDGVDACLLVRLHGLHVHGIEVIAVVHHTFLPVSTTIGKEIVKTVVVVTAATETTGAVVHPLSLLLAAVVAEGGVAKVGVPGAVVVVRLIIVWIVWVGRNVATGRVPLRWVTPLSLGLAFGLTLALVGWFGVGLEGGRGFNFGLQLQLTRRFGVVIFWNDGGIAQSKSQRQGQQNG